MYNGNMSDGNIAHLVKALRSRVVTRISVFDEPRNSRNKRWKVYYFADLTLVLAY